tara:strand:+ start:2455 stop:4089 length:1635 start_codon:yes stop_codon:yes gene_type:complete
MPKKNKSRNKKKIKKTKKQLSEEKEIKKKTKKQLREEKYFFYRGTKKKIKKKVREIKQRQKKFRKGDIETKKTKQKRSLQNKNNSLSNIQNIKQISFSDKGLSNSNNISFEVPNLLNSPTYNKENTRIFMVTGHSSYSYQGNIELEKKYKVLKEDVFKDKKFKNFRHLMLQSTGYVNLFFISYILEYIINLYPNFYKKIIECYTLKEAKKLNYYFLKYINKTNEQLINKYFRNMIMSIYNSKDKITNFKVFPNDKLFLPKRRFHFLELPMNEPEYFGFSLKPLGIYDITKNSNNDFFIFPDEINNIFFEQMIESELNLENLIKYMFRIPNEITKTKLINSGKKGIKKLECLEKKCNLNKTLFERYNNVVKDLINKGIIIEDYYTNYQNNTFEVPDLFNSIKFTKKKDLQNKKLKLAHKINTIKYNFEILTDYCYNNMRFSTKEIYNMIYNSLDNLDENILFIDGGCVGFPEGIERKDINMMKKNSYYRSRNNNISPIKKPPNKYKKREINSYQSLDMPYSFSNSKKINSQTPTPPLIDSYGNWI